LIWTRVEDGLYTSGWYQIRRVTYGYEAWYKSRHELYSIARVASLHAAKVACELRAKNDQARWDAERNSRGTAKSGDYRICDRTTLRSTDLLPANETLENPGVQAREKTQ
jgi:hypothetical protein